MFVLKAKHAIQRRFCRQMNLKFTLRWQGVDEVRRQGWHSASGVE